MYFKTKIVLWFPGGGSLVFNYCLRKGLFSGTSVRWIWSQGESRGGTGGCDKSARCDGGTPYAHAPEQGDNAAYD